VVPKGSDDNQLQAGADPHVQAAVPAPSDVAMVTSPINNLVESRSGLVDAHVEEPNRLRSHTKANPILHDDNDPHGQTRNTVPRTELEVLHGEQSTDLTDGSEMVSAPWQAVDGASANGLPSTESQPPTQEPMIIDPGLLESSSVSYYHV
jgi:hypothetical protein